MELSQCPVRTWRLREGLQPVSGGAEASCRSPSCCLPAPEPPRAALLTGLGDRRFESPASPRRGEVKLVKVALGLLCMEPAGSLSGC